VSAYANSAAAAAAAESELTTSTSATHVDSDEPTQGVGDLVFFYVSGVLYYVSSVINPILYNIMSVKFRQAFVDTILHCSCRRSRRGRGAALELSLAGDGPTAAAVRRYRFAAVGGVREQSVEPASSDAGSQRQRAAVEECAEEVQPLTSSPLDHYGGQVRQLHAADTIVLVECRRAFHS